MDVISDTLLTSYFGKVFFMINYIQYDYANSTVNTFGSDERSFSFPTIRSFLNEMCLHFGSSLEGRIESFRYHIHIKKNVPVFACLTHIFFKADENMWVNFKAIQRIDYRSAKKRCEIIFFDHTSIFSSKPGFVKDIMNHIFCFCHKLCIF